jgi:hypothetical protein
MLYFGLLNNMMLCNFLCIFLGVSSADGSAAFNWLVLAKQVFVGYFLTLLLCGSLSALLFAQGAYAPQTHKH